MKRVWAGVMVIALVMGLQVSALAETSDEARAYFKNGVELLTSNPPNYQDAYYQFKLAYKASGNNWKVLGNLGYAALKLERDAEAIEYYSKYLEEGGDQLSKEEVDQVKRDLLLIRGNMAQMSVTSDVPDLELSVHRVGSNAPAQPYRLQDGKLELAVRAGTQKITAEHDGERKVWEVPLAPGKQKSHEFSFSEPEVAEPAPAAQPTTAADEPAQVDTAPSSGGMSGLRMAGIGTAAAGIGAVAAGVVFGLSASRKESDARGQADNPDICLQSASGDSVCDPSAQDAFDQAKTDAMLSNVLFVAGGVLTAAGVTMVVLGGNKTKEAPSATLQIGPAIGRGGAGLTAFGRF